MRHQRPLNHTWETHSSCCLQALLHLSECQTNCLKPRGVRERARATTSLPLLCPLPCLWKQRDAAKIVKAVVLGEHLILTPLFCFLPFPVSLCFFIFIYTHNIYTYVCIYIHTSSLASLLLPLAFLLSLQYSCQLLCLSFRIYAPPLPTFLPTHKQTLTALH